MSGELPGPFKSELGKELSTENVEVREHKRGKLDDSVIIKRDLDSFPSALKEKALKQFKLLSLINAELRGGWTEKNLVPLIEKYSPKVDLKKPSPRTVARWWKKYESSGGDVSSLVDRNHRKGNRNRKVIGDEAFFHDALSQFLNAKRPSYTKAHEIYHDRIVVENQTIVEGEIPIVTYEAFRKRILKHPPYQVAVARHGKKLADMWFNYFDAHKPPTRILERVEIDHTPLDVILLDDEFLIPLGRPYLTLLMDVFSGCIIGFHISYKAPGYVSVAKALMHAMKPKDYVHELIPDLHNKWLCCGKIESLVVDNGAEFWSKSLEDACLEAKITVVPNKVGKPWLKPFIEREFGIINQMFLNIFPGKTFSNILEREDYDPQKDGMIRFSTFIEEFQRWIIDVHNAKANSRKTRIPNLNWQHSFEVLPPLPLSEQDQKELSVALGVLYTPTMGKRGFKIKHLRYDSPELAEYRRTHPTPPDRRKVKVKLDPDDLSSVYVFLPELDGYLEVPCVDPTGYTEKLSLHQHEAIIRAKRIYIEGEVDIVSLAKARLALIDRIQAEQEEIKDKVGKSKRKIKHTKKQAEFQGVTNTNSSTIAVSEAEKINRKEAPSKEEPTVKGLLSDWDNVLAQLDDE